MTLVFVPSAALRAEGNGTLEVIHARTAHDALFDIRLEGEGGWAVGDHGLLLTSRDEGRTWQPLSVSTDRALLGIDVAPDGTGVIVGQEGTILRASRADAEWSIVDVNTRARLFSVDLDAEGFGLAVGEFGTLLRTLDRGMSWTRLTLDWNLLLGRVDSPHIYDVLVDGPSTALVAGEFETILISRDAGESWSVVHQGEASLFALSKDPSGRHWSMGQSGVLVRSSDQGRTWESGNVGEPLELLDMHLDADGAGVLVGLDKLFFTKDAGASWNADPAMALPLSWVQAVAADPAGRYLLVGAHGSIARLSEAAAPR